MTKIGGNPQDSNIRAKLQSSRNTPQGAHTMATTRYRTKKTTKTLTNGTRVTTTKLIPASPKEWELQAAQVKALRSLPEYGKDFLLAGDQNAAKRGPRAMIEAKASGMTPGEADLRIYLRGGRIRLIENKVGKAPLQPSQKTRHPELAAIGHPVTILRATECKDAALQAVCLVKTWLADNDNWTEDRRGTYVK